MTKEQLMKLVDKCNNSANNVFFTNAGHKLSLKEHRFINSFMVNGDVSLAAKDAGYELKNASDTWVKIGNRILRRDYIYEELLYRIEELEKESIADANEIMEYFTGVMRGEIKDQFGLDAPLSERTAAARELAKRLIDVPQKATENDKAINIVLDWKRD